MVTNFHAIQTGCPCRDERLRKYASSYAYASSPRKDKDIRDVVGCPVM
jgi:hypothetical protein